MTELEAISQRHSVRAFRPEPIPADTVQKLNDFIADCNRHGSLSMKLVTNEPDAFGKSMLAHYGKFSNADNYIAVIGPKFTDSVAGFYGEKVVLYAQALGLNTCWVGLTFKKGKVKQLVPDGEEVFALIAIGYGMTPGVQQRKKTPQQISPDYDRAPQWFRNGVDAAVLAPSAINQQKYRFYLTDDGKVATKRGMGFYTKIDMGIAMCHFLAGAGEDNVSWA